MDKLPGLGDMAGMLNQLRELQGELEKAQKELAKSTVSAESGDGVVRVTVTGDQRVTELEISPALVAGGDAKRISTLLQEAINKALNDSRQMAKDRLGPLSSGLNL
ncbi:MAG: YbaB/EbfC family nucleoid-associated protein [Anaerolineales bacterium]